MARDPGDALARALRRTAAERGVALDIAAVRSTRWASATFTGARHTLRGTAEDTAALASWLGIVPQEDFSIRGQLVADLVIEAVAREGGTATIDFAALTVEDQ